MDVAGDWIVSLVGRRLEDDLLQAGARSEHLVESAVKRDVHDSRKASATGCASHGFCFVLVA